MVRWISRDAPNGLVVGHNVGPPRLVPVSLARRDCRLAPEDAFDKSAQPGGTAIPPWRCGCKHIAVFATDRARRLAGLPATSVSDEQRFGELLDHVRPDWRTNRPSDCRACSTFRSTWDANCCAIPMLRVWRIPWSCEYLLWTRGGQVLAIVSRRFQALARRRLKRRVS